MILMHDKGKLVKPAYYNLLHEITVRINYKLNIGFIKILEYRKL